MKKITLVSHTDTLTGAPRLLMDMADLLYANGYDITFVVKNASGNGLLKLKKGNFPVLELNSYGKTLTERIKNKLKQGFNRQKFKKILQKSDIVINNTIDNSDLMPLYNRYAKGKLITYLHELDAVIDTHLPTKAQKQALVTATSHFILPAFYIKKRVAQKLDISENSISVINSKVLGTLNTEYPLSRAKKEGEFWVGMCGTVDLRKGVDIFVQLGDFLKKNYQNPHIKMVWLGFEGENAKLIEEDVRKLGLEDTLYFLPKTLYPDPFFEAIDILALTSREDPYPLVVLSAATAAKPIICFEQSGGTVDFVEDSCGYIVPFLDIEAYAKSILNLYKNANLREKLGKNAQQRVQEWHHADEPILNQLETVFKIVLDKTTSPKIFNEKELIS